MLPFTSREYTSKAQRYFHEGHLKHSYLRTHLLSSLLFLSSVSSHSSTFNLRRLLMILGSVTSQSGIV